MFLAALVCAHAGSEVAAARPGALDRGFSDDGKVAVVFPPPAGYRVPVNYALPYEFAPGRIAMTQSRTGKVVVASSRALIQYLSNGRRNPGFGGNGTVPIERGDGMRFQIADIAIDSLGRVLVAGTTSPTVEEGLPGHPLAGPLPTLATIYRYLPNGQLDPGFGTAGVLDTYFGVPSPSFEGDPYPRAAVAVVGLAVDAAGRPIVTGSAATEVGRCPRSNERYEASQAFVARLAGNGGPDLTFANGGTRSIGGLSWLGLPVEGITNVLAAGLRTDPCPAGGRESPSVLAGLAVDGNLNLSFGGGGLWSHPFTRVSDLAVSRSGKIVLLARTIELQRGRWVESPGRVVQMRPNGTFDSRFGERGWAAMPTLRRGSISAIAVDRKGRVLVAGSVRRKPRQGKRRRANLRFLLIRLTRKGTVDSRFGSHGRVTTSFGRRTNARATEVLVDRANRIAIGGKFSSPASSNAFAIARYRGGR